VGMNCFLAIEPQHSQSDSVVPTGTRASYVVEHSGQWNSYLGMLFFGSSMEEALQERLGNRGIVEPYVLGLAIGPLQLQTVGLELNQLT
jgi:hypothetical protein